MIEDYFHFRGKKFTETSRPIAHAETDDNGRLFARFKIPEDYGGVHEVIVSEVLLDGEDFFRWDNPAAHRPFQVLGEGAWDLRVEKRLNGSGHREILLLLVSNDQVSGGSSQRNGDHRPVGL